MQMISGKQIEDIRARVDRIRYLSDVYDSLKQKAVGAEDSETVKAELEIAKREMVSISYSIHKAIDRIRQ
jgi:hypothetical protein